MKRILSVILAVTLGLFTTACNQQVEEVILPETTLEPAIVETTVAPSQEPMTFFEEHGLEIENQYDLFPTESIKICHADGELESVYFTDHLIGQVNYYVPLATEKYYEEANITEQIDTMVNLSLTEADLNSDDFIKFVATYMYESSDLTQETTAFDEYLSSFKKTYENYKLITCEVSFQAGGLPKEYYVDGSMNANVYFGFALVDKYTGTAFYPSAGGDALKATINVNGIDYTITAFSTDNRKYNAEEDVISMDAMITALVPTEYDGSVFYVGPSSREQESALVTENRVINFADTPQFTISESETRYFSYNQDAVKSFLTDLEPSPTDSLSQAWVNVDIALMETEMTYDKTATVGALTIPNNVLSQEIVFPEIDKAFEMAGLDTISIRAGDILVQNNKVDVYFTNHDTNDPLTALIVTDAASGKVIGLSGFVQPGESIDSIPVEEGFEGEQVVLFMAMFEPETQLDNGVILLSSFINN